MSLDPVAFKKTKHVMRASYFLRDVVSKGYIDVTHLSGSDMVADALTKAVARSLYLRWASLLRDFARIAAILDRLSGASPVSAQ